MGTQGENGDGTHCTAVYLCTSFFGTPQADGKEMHGALFLSPDDTEVTHVRPLKEDVLYNGYDFSDEIKEYEATYPKDEREAARKRASTRARFRDEWESHDMDEVIHRILKSPKIQSPTKTGKVAFVSDETPLYVCYDLHADYFKVMHKNKRGQAKYHGVKGEPLLNYREENGKTHGIPAVASKYVFENDIMNNFTIIFRYRHPNHDFSALKAEYR